MIKTPCYIVDEDTLNNNMDIMERTFTEQVSNFQIALSVKTNHYSFFLKKALEKKWYAEVVSYEEYRLAKAAGYEDKMILINGPQKQDLLLWGLGEGVTLNLDNLSEVEYVCANKNALACKIGLRVNFDYQEYDIESQKNLGFGSRFGICYENGDLERAIRILEMEKIDIKGLHIHISSQSRNKEIYGKSICVLAEIIKKYNLSVDYVDIGGGFWGGRESKRYPSLREYAEYIGIFFKKNFQENAIKLIIEPGASVIATAVGYRTKVIDVKDIRGNRVVTVDGTILDINPFMNERSAEYGTSSANDSVKKMQWLVGATCMEKDCLVKLENEKELQIGDIIDINYTGAYTICFNNCFINVPPRIYLKKKREYILLRDKNVDIMQNI